MSKILEALTAAAGVTRTRNESDSALVERLLPKIAELDDAAWDKLTPEAQDYFNDAADASNKKEPIPALPDAAPAAPATRTRRGAAAPAPAPAPEVEPAADPVKGDRVRFTTKRGKTIEGEYVEIDGKVHVYVNDAGNEDEVPVEGTTVEVLSPASDSNEPAEPVVGDQVEVVTKRGKTITGELVEVDGDVFVVDVNGKEEELSKDRITSIKVVGGAAAAPAAPAPASSRRGAAKAEATPAPAAAPATSRRGAAPAADAPAAPAKRASTTANGGVSVTGRIRELIVANPKATVEDISNTLRKEKLEFRDNTLALVYSDSHKLIALLVDAGKLKL